MLAQWRAWRDVKRNVSSTHWPLSAERQSIDWLLRTVGLSVHGEILCADMPWVDSRTVTQQEPQQNHVHVWGFWRPAESPHVALAISHGKMSFVSHLRLVTTAPGVGLHKTPLF